jgi:ERCC4-type nuclease
MSQGFLITTNEPAAIKNLFVDRIETPMNFDMKLYTEAGTVGIERKKIPGDLISSVEDGRLRRELIAMREECDHRVLLLHGVFRYNRKGQVVDNKHVLRWTETGIRNLLRTIEWVEGCFIEQARTTLELVSIVTELQSYLDTQKHFSLKGRPGIQKSWIVPTKSEHVIHFYDGLPGIAPVRAKLLMTRFPNPIELYEASIEDIASIKGFGIPVATQIHNFLRGL